MKIIQIMMTPDNSLWQGTLLGLANDGAVYRWDGRWIKDIPPLKEYEHDGGTLEPALRKRLQYANGKLSEALHKLDELRDLLSVEEE